MSDAGDNRGEISPSSGGRLAELHALRDAMDDRYWKNPAVEAEEIALVDAERHPAAKALRAIDGAMKEIGDWSTLAATFDGLPEPVHKAVADELMSEAPIWPESVSWDDVQAFRSTPAGAELCREWRDEAAQKLAVIRERAWRIFDKLSEAECIALSDWFDSLPTDDAKAVMRLLAGAQ